MQVLGGKLLQCSALLLLSLQSVLAQTLTTPDCYSFDQPSLDTLRASTKKVFAWYFPPYELSISNEADSSNYYERWLSPSGGNNEYQNTGGALRDRPLTMPHRTESNWKQLNFQMEIRQAIAMGLDGFIMEMSYLQKHPDDRFNRVLDMLNAAKAVDPGFKIMLGPGFPKNSNDTSDQLVSTIVAVANHSSVFRLPDGRTPLITFYPERPASSGGKPISWWKSAFEKMKANGINVAWYPMFLSRSTIAALPDADQWYQTMTGYSRWDGRWESQAKSNVDEAAQAKSRGVDWMARVSFQEMRVRKDKLIELKHLESSNSATLRAFFEKAIESGSNWVTLLTWSDYSETQMAPSRNRGYTVGDIVAYYTAWFKTGSKPAIIRDGLYYIHRKQHANATYNANLQTAGAFKTFGGPVPENNVELLAFLTESGNLTIIQGSNVRSLNAAAGMTSFKVPLVPGTTPKFELHRNGALVTSFTSRTPIQTSVDYQDMTYYAGSSIKCVRPLGAPFGSTVTIQSACNGKYVSSEGAETNPMWCNRDAPDCWEKFEVIDAGNGQVALKALNKYVTSTNGTVSCTKDAVSSLEKFFWFSNIDGTFSLKCSSGKFVSSECGNAAITCNKDAVGEPEKFNYAIL